ncbi:MAG: SDR family NAD(P)-dependent oxidoreductase [Parvibaculum sp.]
MDNAFKDQPLAGKVAFIAGASSGINLGIAQHFARAGAKVAVISRSAEKIAAAAKTMTDEGFSAMGIAADVCDFAAVDGALKAVHDAYGKIDIVISGAAGELRRACAGDLV